MKPMPFDPSRYPARRGWAFPAAVPLENYPALAAARDWSCWMQERMRACLTDLPRRAPQVRTVAVSGSLGRLEAGPHSDADLIVVLADDVPAGRSRSTLMSAVWDLLTPLALPRPDPTGIFATPVAWGELCERRSVGRVVENVNVFGKRLQLLLDTQPVFGEETYSQLVRSVLQRYASGFVGRDARKEWTYLLNDLIRYFRSLCVLSQWDFSKDGGGWYGRSAKLRHSRVALYAGLLFLLGECSKERVDKVGWLTPRLSLTPLERIASVYVAQGDRHFERVAAVYDRFLALAADAATGAVLAEAAPAQPEDLASTVPPAYAELHANSRALLGELVRFVLARRESWGDAFFEYLLF